MLRIMRLAVALVTAFAVGGIIAPDPAHAGPTPSPTPSPSVNPTSDPSPSPTATPDPSPSPSPEPTADPIVVFEDTCDGVVIHLANGVDAELDAKFSISAGGSPGIQFAPVPPGATPTPINTAVIDLVVSESVTGQTWPHTWTEPDDCPNPAPAPGKGGSLPQTGSAVAWLALGGLALLLIGGGLYFLVRQRRIDFTPPSS